MLYSQSKNSFFHPDTAKDLLPSDCIEISDEKWQTIIAALGTGKVLKADKNGNPIADNPDPLPTEKVIELYEAAAQRNLDSVAQSWGYDSILTAISYVSSTNAQYKAEAEALNAWRDSYWAEAYTIEQGTLPDTAEAFVAMLPAAPTKPTV